MARDIDDAVSEEEDRELEEADDLQEQEFEDEYSEDSGGENLQPTVGATKAKLAFLCSVCNYSIPAAGREAMPKMHCGKRMLLVDREAHVTLPFGTRKPKSPSKPKVSRKKK